jgi:alpha-L-fucosidase
MITMLMILISLLSFALVPHSHSYEATWESLDARPLPVWYDDAKFGIFLHWGVFSVPAYGSEWFWNNWQGSTAQPRYADFVAKTEGPRFSYPDYAHRIDATLYRPEEWADFFARAGAQYVVLTSKHHEGYAMWDSRDIPTTWWNWNAMDVGPKRDLLGDLAKQIKNSTSPQTNKPIKFGV